MGISAPVPVHSGTAQKVDRNRSATASTVPRWNPGRTPPPTDRQMRSAHHTGCVARSFESRALRESTKPSGWRAVTERLSEAVAGKAKDRPGNVLTQQKRLQGVPARASQRVGRCASTQCPTAQHTGWCVNRGRYAGRKLRWDNSCTSMSSLGCGWII